MNVPRSNGQEGSAGIYQFERRERIMERVIERGRADVAELAAEFEVSGETIRRDLTELQRERLVRRVHGGAIPYHDSIIVPPLQVRQSRNIDEKRRIAAAAVEEVPLSGAILIDSGSTAAHLAELIPRDRDLTVITNSIPIVRSLATTKRPDVVVLGGTLRRRTMAFVDETGVDELRDIVVDTLFVGCDGVSPERGFTTPYRSEVAIKRAMMVSARRTVMMFDHSKMHNDQMLRFAAIHDVEVIVTGVEVDEAMVRVFEDQGPAVIRA